MLKPLFATALLFLLVIPCLSQVEHNFPVDPQKTSCDSLPANFSNAGEAIQQIEITSFRFNQQFKLTRTWGITAGNFYSCDNTSGFLILTFENAEKQMIRFVPKILWNEFIQSSDLNEFYQNKIQPNYEIWAPD